MFDNLKNMAGMIGQAKQMQAKMEELQAELGRKSVEADAGAGAVHVVANGKLEILSVRIDPAMLATLTGSGSETDQRMVEDLITAATNLALAKAREMIQQEMSRLAGGLNVPGMDQMLGMLQGPD